MEDVLLIVAQNTPLTNETFWECVAFRRTSKRFRANLPMFPKNYTAASVDIKREACRRGDLAVVQSVLTADEFCGCGTHGQYIIIGNLLFVAASEGHEKVVAWFVAEGFAWDENIEFAAVFHGRLGVLQWAHSHGLEITGESREYATMKGHGHILAWLSEIGR